MFKARVSPISTPLIFFSSSGRFFALPTFLGILLRPLRLLRRRHLRLNYRYRLELNGLSYKCWLSRRGQGRVLLVDVGRSHYTVLDVPEAVHLRVKKWKFIRLKSLDFEPIRRFVLALRSLRPPDPYKAKGVRFRNERFRLKIGKKR